MDFGELKRLLAASGTHIVDSVVQKLNDIGTRRSELVHRLRAKIKTHGTVVKNLETRINGCNSAWRMGHRISEQNRIEAERAVRDEKATKKRYDEVLVKARAVYATDAKLREELSRQKATILRLEQEKKELCETLHTCQADVCEKLRVIGNQCKELEVQRMKMIALTSKSDTLIAIIGNFTNIGDQNVLSTPPAAPPTPQTPTPAPAPIMTLRRSSRKRKRRGGC